VSNSEEIQANLERAKASLQAAKVLLASDLLDDATSRAYYGAFHAATALLLSRDLSFGSHAGVLRAISLNFVKTGSLPKAYGRDLSWLAELRQIADYGEMRHVTTEEAERAIQATEQFLHQVQEILNTS